MGRHKLVKFFLKKGNKKWILKNDETKKISYIKINDVSPEFFIHKFLKDISAYDEFSMPRTNAPISYDLMVDSLMNGNIVPFWIPSNKIENVKKTYFTEEKIIFKDYLLFI